MLKSLRFIFELIGSRARNGFVLIVFAIFLMGILQIAGIGLLVPFASMLLNPAAINESDTLMQLFSITGLQTADEFLVLLGVVLLVVLLLGNAFSAFTTWMMARFVWKRQCDLSVRLFSKYIAEDYSLSMQRDTPSMTRNIIFESMQVCNGVLMPMLKILSSVITVAFIIGLLGYLNPLISGAALVLFGAGYFVIYLFVRRPLMRVGRVRSREYKARLKSVAEGFGSLKEVKILGRETALVGKFREAASAAANAEVAFNSLSMLPKYLLESVALGFIVVSLLYLFAAGEDAASQLPLVVAFLFAGYRLLPALQTIFKSMSALRFNREVLDSFYRELVLKNVAGARARSDMRISFQRLLKLSNVSYTYPGEATKTLNHITLEIPRGAFVGFVGKTGAGKTTLVDVILGLLRPQHGFLEVDGRAINHEESAVWQRSFGYVPQETFLLDDSVASNIAFGLPEGEIDMAAVVRAAKVANIHEFVSTELSRGYASQVGERGVRLSGGQRQRIGLARALYQDPPILVLDEATSALDGTTEALVHDAIRTLAKSKTVILIAHRLTTVMHCDAIFLLEKGEIKAYGTYQELLASSSDFREMAGLEAA